MMRFVQSYARAHAHAYPHTPMPGPRTHIGIFFNSYPNRQ
jgi:hypothetical protein